MTYRAPLRDLAFTLRSFVAPDSSGAVLVADGPVRLGRVAAVHAVWRSQADWKAMARHPSVNAAMEPILALATFEPHLYEPGELID